MRHLWEGSDSPLASLRVAARRLDRIAPEHPLLAEALGALDRAVIEAGEAEEKLQAAAEALGGLLAGVTVSGVLLALFQANAGGAWDNAKKMFEEGDGLTIDGQSYGKGSEPHKAAVVGDTVGDPLKDTSGPSLNILLKLMSVIALVIAPLLVG